MKWHTQMHASLLRKIALFLEEHPGFWPELVGEDALVCGFHVGGCSLTIGEMEKWSLRRCNSRSVRCALKSKEQGRR